MIDNVTPNFHTFEELPKFEDDQEAQKSHS